MWPTLLDFGSLRITFLGAALVVGFVLGSFILWRRLKEDYDEEKLLTLWLWLVVSAWLGSGVWVWWSNGWRQIWGAVILPFLFLLYWCKKYKWDSWEILDVAGPVSLAVILLGGLGWGPEGALMSLVAAGGLIASSIVRGIYRKWRWYKSGKAGLVSLVALLTWAGINLVVANFQLWAVYSLAWIVVLIGVVVYLRSGRQISQIWLEKNKKPAKT